MEFPEDGLCDVIFYDSLYCNDENAFLDSPSSDLSEFLDLLKGFKKTAFGISVSYRYLSLLSLRSRKRSRNIYIGLPLQIMADISYQTRKKFED